MKRPAELDDADRKRPLPPPVADAYGCSAPGTFIRPMGVREAREQFDAMYTEFDRMRRDAEQLQREAAYMRGEMSRGEFHRISHLEQRRFLEGQWTPDRLTAADWWLAAGFTVIAATLVAYILT